jgi:hypothetical protein
VKSSTGNLSGAGACQTIYLGTNGGTDTVSITSGTGPMTLTVNGSSSQSGVSLVVASQSNAQGNNLYALAVCATALNNANASAGSYSGSVVITDQFNNTTTIPVVVAISSTNEGEIGVFRSITPGSGGPALFALDVNGNYKYDSGIDKFRQFGLDGDYPVAGDWTGSGVSRIGVFRPAQGAWFLDLNNNGTWDGVSGGDGVFSFGLPGDIPVVGDWNGNGIAKFGVFRCPSSGVCTFVLDYAGKQAFDPSTAQFLSYGLPGDYPVANNWNGVIGGADEIGVFRCPKVGQPGVCTWYVNSTGTGFYSSSDMQYTYGLPGDLPIVGNWNGTGRKRIGVFRSGTVILNVSGSNVYDYTDQITSFGLPGDKPVFGNWSGPLATNP